MLQEVLKYKWALLVTLGFHILMLVGFNQYRFTSTFKPLELVEMPILLDPEEIKKDPKLLQRDELKNSQNEKIENRTVNESDRNNTHNNGNYDSRKYSGLNDRVEEEVKNLEQQFRDEYRSKHPEKEGVNSGSVNSHPDETANKTEKNKNQQSDGASNQSSHSTGFAKVSGSYSLSGRRDEYFAKPAYVCKGSGTIVLKIKVNRNGKVISAGIDNSQSSYTEECMAESAVKYAYKCKFEAGASFPDPQSGTITYSFISQ